MSNIENATEQNKTYSPTTYSGMNEVFRSTKMIIDEMEDGQRIGVKDLADKVAAKVENMAFSNIMSLVQLFCKENKGFVTVELGRAGGVYKGQKKQRIDARPRCSTCNQVMRPNKQHIQQ